MDEAFKYIEYTEAFYQIPVFIADMQTTNGGDTANLRWQNSQNYGIEVRVYEEESKDREIKHKTESVGYMAFSE